MNIDIEHCIQTIFAAYNNGTLAALLDDLWVRFQWNDGKSHVTNPCIRFFQGAPHVQRSKNPLKNDMQNCLDET